MDDRSIRRRQLLAGSLTAGLAGTAGCLRVRPDATHWAAGIRWRDPPSEVREERGFIVDGTLLSAPVYPRDYIRVNDGELHRVDFPSDIDSVPADRGDRVEYVVDFDSRIQDKETVFEYTIPDDDELVGVLAGFAECLRYRGTDEWVVRPLNVDLDTDIFGRQKETLLVTVNQDDRDHRLRLVWGHTESIRNEVRDRAARSDVEYEHEFLDPDEAATFSPAAFNNIIFTISNGAEPIQQMSYPEPDAER